MEKFSVKLLLFILYVSTSIKPIYPQSISESEIRNLASEVDQGLKGVDLGNGIFVRGCHSIGRTLVYEYEVPQYWQESVNLKSSIISNLKSSGTALTYTSGNIDVIYNYFKGNILVSSIKISANELSDTNYILGDYISLRDHPKSNGVNLEIRSPLGWEIQEGDRPNIVKKFSKGGNMFAISIEDNITFFSRRESKELLEDDLFVESILEEMKSLFIEGRILNKSIVTIDNYPTLKYTITGKREQSGVTISSVMIGWFILYEDKLIALQGWTWNAENFDALQPLFFMISNSVILPDQYD